MKWKAIAIVLMVVVVGGVFAQIDDYTWNDYRTWPRLEQQRFLQGMVLGTVYMVNMAAFLGNEPLVDANMTMALMGITIGELERWLTAFYIDHPSDVPIWIGLSQIVYEKRRVESDQELFQSDEDIWR